MASSDALRYAAMVAGLSMTMHAMIAAVILATAGSAVTRDYAIIAATVAVSLVAGSYVGFRAGAAPR